MAKPRKTNAAPKPWSTQDVRTLKKLAGAQPKRQIARALKRSEAAVTFKAFKLRLSLAQKNRPRRKTVRKAR
jgi:hypothetical protein